MKHALIIFCLFCGWGPFAYAQFSHLFPYFLQPEDREKQELIFERADTPLFDELILSWNAPRTSEGDYAFFVSLRQSGIWSDFLYYGDWGVRGQMLTGEAPDSCFAKTGRGLALAKTGSCDGFRIRVISAGKAKLSQLETLWVCVSHLSQFSSMPLVDDLEPIFLGPLPLQSTYTLRMNRHVDMTMVASMLSALQYLGKKPIDKEQFVSYIMDGDYECYDFWPLHVAESYHRLEGSYHVYAQRLNDFPTLHSYLKQGCPVLVDIQGSPFGGITWPPYRSHILCIIGYDPKTRKIHCLDPIFPSDKSTYNTYNVDDFIRVWSKRKNMACVFTRRSL